MPNGRDTPLLLGAKTDTGLRREKNEDSTNMAQAGRRQLFVVADGMGGEIGGQQASAHAVQAALDHFAAHAEDAPAALLGEAVAAANQRLLSLQRADPALSGMGTTLELVLVEDRCRVWWAHVGDSRIWLVSGGAARQLTADHTLVQQMLDGGLITEAEAREHPKRHVLSRVVGRDPGPPPDVSPAPIVLAEGDAVVMASDGLADLVSAGEIAHLVARCGPQVGCERLVELANQRGGHDNITVRAMYYGRESRSWARDTPIEQLVPPPAPASAPRGPAPSGPPAPPASGLPPTRFAWIGWTAGAIALFLFGAVAGAFVGHIWWPAGGSASARSTAVAAGSAPAAVPPPAANPPVVEPPPPAAPVPDAASGGGEDRGPMTARPQPPVLTAPRPTKPMSNVLGDWWEVAEKKKAPVTWTRNPATDKLEGPDPLAPGKKLVLTVEVGLGGRVRVRDHEGVRYAGTMNGGWNSIEGTNQRTGWEWKVKIRWKRP